MRFTTTTAVGVALCMLAAGACSDNGETPPSDTGTEDAAETTLSDADAAADAVDVDGPPNISTVLQYPWTPTPPHEPNTAWRNACEAEVPNGGPVTPPPRPANSDNCGGDPAKCGPQGGQRCDAEPAASEWLHRVTLDTTTYPEAVCGDGSPGVIEVRPGSGVGANRWLIWFKGGSGCQDQAVCAKRWCGNQSGSTYRADIMSTDWNGDGAVDRAHCARPESGSSLDPNLADNPFANANIVKIFYCSSDNHAGTRSVDLVDMNHDEDAVQRDFSVHAKGRSVALAALESLFSGVSSDSGAVTLPSIGDATQVVVAGSSAGSKGAMQNLDDFSARIRAVAPTARVLGVLDANVPPSDAAMAAFDLHVDATYDELQTPGAPLSDWLNAREVSSWTDGWYAASGTFVDASCAAHVQATEGDAGMHACLRPASLLLTFDADGPVLTTPTFVRFDLGDGVIGGIYKPCKDPVTGQDCYAPNHSVISDASAAPNEWLNLQDSSDHNRFTLEQIFDAGGAVTGIFAPLCGTHTGFTNANFTEQSTRDYGDSGFSGEAVNFMQTLSTWLTTQTPVRVIDASKSSAAPPSAACHGTEG
jgi:hypothetical protein